MDRSSCMAADIFRPLGTAWNRAGFEQERREQVKPSRKSEDSDHAIRKSGSRSGRPSTCWSPAPAMSGWPPPSRMKQARPHLAVAVVDAAPEGVWEKDGRASAIAAAACRMLDRLGCWDEIAPEAQPINDMIVTDSRTADPVRPVFLTFDGEVGAGEPFAHMVANSVLNGALRRRAAELGIDIIEGVAVARFRRPASPMCWCIWPTASPSQAAAGRGRRRQIAAARHGRHQDGEVGIRPVRHRLHGRA